MTIQEAIKKIEEAGFTANYWSKGDKHRIYIDFTFNGSNRTGGFLCKDGNSLIAQACGKKTKRYQDKLDEIAKFDIEWNTGETKGRKIITEKQAAANYYKTERENFNREFLIGY